MAFMRSLVRAEAVSTSMNQSEAGPGSVKMEEQKIRTVLPKRTRASKGKQKVSVAITAPSNNIVIATEPGMKRRNEDSTNSTQDKKVKVECVPPAQTFKAEPVSQSIKPSFTIEAIKVEPSTQSQSIKGEPFTSQATAVKPAATKVKKEPKTVTPRIKKESQPKVPKLKKELKPKVVKVKKEPKPKVPKRKPAFKLPPEASIYLNDAMQARVTRAMKQRMFVMSRELSPENDSIETFEVLGSVGNNYTVTIAPTIKCTCMDYAIKRIQCKHILMILLKVYRLPFNSVMFRSIKTTTEQRLEARTHACMVDPSVLVPREIREKILSITHRNHPQAAPVIETTTTRRPLDTSDCPVCFEEFEEPNIDQIDFCKTCGNNIHKECFQLWARSKGANVSCVYCRSKWVTEEPATGPSKRLVKQLDPAHINESYYANFADELGISRKRDTSTYKINGSYPLRGAEFEN